MAWPDTNLCQSSTNLHTHSPGDELWRVEVTHFTPWDYNWPYTCPCSQPNPDKSPNTDGKCQNDCENETGSYVEERSRIFHEDIPVPGTGFTLHYASNRVAGYRTEITVPASGDTVPDELKRIIVRVEVAGRKYERVLDALPNQTAVIEWGREHRGFGGLCRSWRLRAPTATILQIVELFRQAYHSDHHKIILFPGVREIWSPVRILPGTEAPPPRLPARGLLPFYRKEIWEISVGNGEMVRPSKLQV